MKPESAITHITATLNGLLSEYAQQPIGASKNDQSSPAKLVVAYSGGVDSTVLLHVIAHAVKLGQLAFCRPQFSANSSLTPKHSMSPFLQAVHINHGLQDCAPDMEQHCQNTCHSLAIPFFSYRVTVATGSRTSTEQAAREARYQALIEHAKQHNAAICLAQHQTDQLETMLLQLKRGAGPKGLSGMPAIRIENGVALLRPLLELSQQDVLALAEYLDCKWVEDPSNSNTQHDRNFIRQALLPTLLERWPSFGETVSRSARLCAEQTALIESEAALKLASIMNTDGTLSITKLSVLSEGWQKQVIRAWLAQMLVAMPSEAQMTEIRKLTQAKQDAQPVVYLPNGQLRRYRQSLHLLPFNNIAGKEAESQYELSLVLSDSGSFLIPWLGKTIQVQRGVDTESPSKALCDIHITARADCLSSAIKPINRKTKTVKAWCKEWAIPPWQRKLVTVISVDDIPTAVVTPTEVVRLHHGSDNVILTLCE